MPELPPPLPPGERTVGQLVAETIRAYGDNFWRLVPLALPIAALQQLTPGRDGPTRTGLFLAFAPLLSFAYARAAAIVGHVEPSRRTLAVATATGTAVLLPASLFFTWFQLLIVVYLAFLGLAVPVVVLEGSGSRAAVRRALELARADHVHALGSLAALVIVFSLSQWVLVALLQSQADETIRIAVFLADLVLAPLMLLGGAMLYFDQAARVGSARSDRRRGRDADLHPPIEADAAGRADAPLEP